MGDKPWGMREFAVVDGDGTLLRIGQVLTPDREGTRRALPKPRRQTPDR